MNSVIVRIVVLFFVSLSGSCAVISEHKQDILNVGRAGAVVLSADELAVQIAHYIAGDQVAIDALLQPDGPVDYGLKVADFMKGNLSVPVVEVMLSYPAKLATFKSNMLQAQLVLLDYERRSKKPIPPVIQVMWQNGVEAMDLFDRAANGHDTTTTISRIYQTVAPWAQLGLALAGSPLGPVL